MNFFGLKFGKNEEQNFVTISEWTDFIDKINGGKNFHHGDPLYYLKDKTVLLKRFGQNLKRDFLDLEESSLNDFVKFTNKHKKIIVKPKDWSCGQGIEIIDITDDIKINKLYSSLIERKRCLIEEYIVQHRSLSEIYPDVVSTVRIYTLNVNESVEIVSYPLLRIPTSLEGIKNTDVITLKADLKTGRCADYGIITKEGQRSIQDNPVHPSSGVLLSNFKIPFFDNVKELAIYAARLVPEITFAGWDIAITEDGAVMIEGNGEPYNFLDENYISKREKDYNRMDYYNKMVEYVKFRKNTYPEVIEKMTNKVFLEENSEDLAPDAVMIFGDRDCDLDVREIISRYKNNPIYICSDTCLNTKPEEFDYLVECGIPKENIFCENQSKNCKQSVENSFKLLRNVIQKSHLKQIESSRKIKINILCNEIQGVYLSDLVRKYSNKYDLFLQGVYTAGMGKDDWYKSFKGYCSLGFGSGYISLK